LSLYWGFVPPVYLDPRSNMTGIIVSAALLFGIVIVILLIAMRK
jgi:hypothetical protein